MRPVPAARTPHLAIVGPAIADILDGAALGREVDGDTRLRLRVLGELAATRDGAVVDLGGRRQRAVLAALVIMRDQVVPADRLADCVWGDAAPANPTGRDPGLRQPPAPTPPAGGRWPASATA